MIGVPFVFALALAAAGTAMSPDYVVRQTQTAPDTQLAQPARFDPSRFDSVTAVALRTIFDTASAHHIPTSPLIDRALQGAAMRSPGAKIVSVVRAQYAALLDARAALGESSTDELAFGADAIRAGIDGRALVLIRSARPSVGSAATALMVATDLVNRGIPINKAGDAVSALARTSKTDDTINALQKLVAKNAGRGPGMAQDALDRYVRVNAPGGSPPPSSKPATRPPGPPDAP